MCKGAKLTSRCGAAADDDILHAGARRARRGAHALDGTSSVVDPHIAAINQTQITGPHCPSHVAFRRVSGCMQHSRWANRRQLHGISEAPKMPCALPARASRQKMDVHPVLRGGRQGARIRGNPLRIFPRSQCTRLQMHMGARELLHVYVGPSPHPGFLFLLTADMSVAREEIEIQIPRIPECKFGGNRITESRNQ